MRHILFFFFVISQASAECLPTPKEIEIPLEKREILRGNPLDASQMAVDRAPGNPKTFSLEVIVYDSKHQIIPAEEASKLLSLDLEHPERAEVIIAPYMEKECFFVEKLGMTALQREASNLKWKTIIYINPKVTTGKSWIKVKLKGKPGYYGYQENFGRDVIGGLL